MFGIGDGEIQRVIGAQREANHGKATVGLAGTFAEEACCIGDLGPGLEVVGVERLAKGFGIGNRVCDLAMIQVWGEGDETSFGQSRANGSHGVVQPPPRVEHEHAWPVAAFG